MNQHLPLKQFSSFLCSVVFQQKTRWSSDQRFRNASDYFEIGLEDKNADSRAKQWKKKKKLSVKVFSLIWICNRSHTNVRKEFTLLRVIPSLLLSAFFQLILLRSSHNFIAIHIFYLNNEFFKNNSRRRVFRNVNLSNWKLFYREI